MTDIEFTLLRVISLITDASLAGVLLLRPWPQVHMKAGLGRVIKAALGTSILFVCKLPFFLLCQVNVFGLINLVYLDLVVILPLFGLLMLLLRRRVTRPVCIFGLLCVLIVPLALYASFIEPYRLRLETVRIPLSPDRSGTSPLRIGVLSDLQTVSVTDYERKAVEMVMSAKPDLILMPGDFTQGTAQRLGGREQDFRDLLSRLDAPGGVYAVTGNLDRVPILEKIFTGTRIRLLQNEVVRIAVRDRKISLFGVDYYRHGRALWDKVSLLEQDGDPEDIRLVLVHNPNIVMAEQLNKRTDLFVAGHTHGGQVRLPGLGAMMNTSALPRSIAAGGVHMYKGGRVFISRGVGHEIGQAPRIRFLCPPEVSIIELVPPDAK